MSFIKTTLNTMAKGLSHAHDEGNLNFSIKSTDGKVTNATTEQIFSEPQPNPLNENNKRKYIAMYLGSDLPEKMMAYVIESCQHLNHDLAVISFEQNATTDESLAPYKEVLEESNIKVKKVKLSGSPMPELNKYLKSHRDIVFLACKDSGFLGRSYMSGNHAKHSLPVPLVVVTTEQQEQSNTPIETIELSSKKTKVA